VSWAQALYACDPLWWDHHIDSVRSGFSGELWTQDQATAKKHGLNWIQGYHHPGISKTPTHIHFNSNSGAQALNLAAIWGAKRILLIGFDMKLIAGKRHWFGDHPGPLNKNSDYRDWITKYQRIAIDLERMGIECFNCSMESALDCFPKRRLDELLTSLSARPRYTAEMPSSQDCEPAVTRPTPP
jgi:hypothetical protein